MHTYARESGKIKKKQFSRVTSHDLLCENKTFKLKRFITVLISFIVCFIGNKRNHSLDRHCLLLGDGCLNFKEM